MEVLPDVTVVRLSNSKIGQHQPDGAEAVGSFEEWAQVGVFVGAEYGRHRYVLVDGHLRAT